MTKDYFNNYTKGEAYVYGLKCISNIFESDERSVVTVLPGENMSVTVTHNTESRKFVRYILKERAVLDVNVCIQGRNTTELDMLYEVVHEGNNSRSNVSISGFVEDTAHAIVRLTTIVPHTAFYCEATQSVHLYQFSNESVIDCIPILEVKNKTTRSSHAVRLETVSDIAYWYAAKLGLNVDFFEGLVKDGLMKI